MMRWCEIVFRDMDVAKYWHAEKGAGFVPAISPILKICSFFFLTTSGVQAAPKRYKNVTVLS
ncbi:MAG: hypothetical protein GQ556_01660 [Desulfobacterales bacterium]|nr:hypothetical protein [Desulfobacterales bacterium]